MAESATRIDGWFIVELMGHRRLAGRVSEVTIAGAGFLRVDVPGDAGQADVATQFFQPSSVYALTPTTEELARRVAKTCRPAPVSRFELPAETPPRSEPDPKDDEDDTHEEPLYP